MLEKGSFGDLNLLQKQGNSGPSNCPFDRLRLQRQSVNWSFTKLNHFKFQRSLPMSAPKRPNDFFEFFTVPQEFQIGFGRKVLPDWVIASRARIWFHLISEGPLVHEWQTRECPRKVHRNREHFMPSCATQ
jgi:hypothetical protein